MNQNSYFYLCFPFYPQQSLHPWQICQYISAYIKRKLPSEAIATFQTNLKIKGLYVVRYEDI